MFSVDRLQRQPIHHAAAGGCIEILKLLQSKGVPLDVVDYGGATPLHHAAARGQLGIVHYLVLEVNLYINFSEDLLLY